VESGKTAIAYTSAISSSVLSLFKITIGASSAADKVEITGTDLPYVAGATSSNLIIIDIGITGADNSGLPTFYIPDGELGAESPPNEDYSYIRLRVNQGAELVILADNSSYISSGAGNPCSAGKFKGGAVEVLAGGKLRDGAFEGFPLGTGAVIVNRAGSYLSVGPEPESEDATGSKSTAYNQFYSGYLIGPSASGARVEWGDSNGYLEVRSKQLITNAALSVKKLLGLIYSVWFLPGAGLEIETGATLIANEGNDADYNFYVVSPGDFGNNFIALTGEGQLDKRFLTSGAKNSPDLTNSGSFGATYDGEVSAMYGNLPEFTGYLIIEEEE
jgi:hypothetical protein